MCFKFTFFTIFLINNCHKAIKYCRAGHLFCKNITNMSVWHTPVNREVGTRSIINAHINPGIDLSAEPIGLHRGQSQDLVSIKP